MIDVDVETRVVTVGDDTDLLRAGLGVARTSWVDAPVGGRVRVQASAHGATQLADVTVEADRVVVTWVEPQRRIAPGQSVVFYDLDDRRVLGGGICAT